MNRTAETLARFGLTLQILKTALAAAISWFVATSLLHAEYPYFAALAAILTVQVTVADSVEKATQRIIGIVGGVMISMLMGHWFKIGAISIFLVILIGMGISKALRMNPQIISQVAISSFLVLAFGQTQEGYAFARIIETIIGSTIAVILNALIVPKNAIPDVKSSITTFSSLSATTLKSLNTLLDDHGSKRKTGRSEVDALVKETDNCHQTLQLAEQSLKYNPLLTRERTRIKRLSVSVTKLEHITVQIRGIRRGLADLQLNPVFKQEYSNIAQFKVAMEATANCIATFGQTIVDSSEINLSRLKKAIQEARAEQAHCLTDLKGISSLETLRDVGGVLTDLSRIVAETERQNPIKEEPKA
ncbi:aromatic acid exporter family protein [Pontibacter silvestris]|uniref:Aromatic acid exporter family protein n=1 Tax=Pontibacter silvestris TaxID=2305183 RepID=A0ABW4X0C6_9BACT|nr:aromatic acid exporter family protein [Pontibacter silvestris]MCC9135250.1 aromatic acid exporter family protein [Pontibacter silvestris]